jgi:putative oxidoreductase
MSKLILKVRQWHGQFFDLVSYLQSPFLLLVRLNWGWQLAQSGWGKLHHLSNVGEYFAALGLPMPAQMAVLIACVEFFGGIFLALGLASRITALVLTVNLSMAYIIGDSDALLSFFSDPDKFTAAAPFAFLMVALIVLIFGAGRISADTVIAFLFSSARVKQANSVSVRDSWHQNEMLNRRRELEQG